MPFPRQCHYQFKPGYNVFQVAKHISQHTPSPRRSRSVFKHQRAVHHSPAFSFLPFTQTLSYFPATGNAPPKLQVEVDRRVLRRIIVDDDIDVIAVRNLARIPVFGNRK